MIDPFDESVRSVLELERDYKDAEAAITQLRKSLVFFNRMRNITKNHVNVDDMSVSELLTHVGMIFRVRT